MNMMLATFPVTKHDPDLHNICTHAHTAQMAPMNAQKANTQNVPQALRPKTQDTAM